MLDVPMPAAGFYAIHSAKIRFGRDGLWYSDDERITNPRIAELFAKHIRRQPDGTYAICMADERAPVEVDDTPYVVTDVTVDKHAITVHLNDGSQETLAPGALVVGAGNVLYVPVKNGTERARLLRSAYYQLSQFMQEERGCFFLQVGTVRHPLVFDAR